MRFNIKATILFAAIFSSALCTGKESDALLLATKQLDIDLNALTSTLFQQAYSAFDATGSRQLFETRFIPNTVNAYQVEDDDGLVKIMIVVSYVNTKKELDKAASNQICQGMLNWSRFQLGIKDNGTPIAYASEFQSSSLYKYITPAKTTNRTYASLIDSRTILIARVAPLGTTYGPPALCRATLTQ